MVWVWKNPSKKSTKPRCKEGVLTLTGSTGLAVGIQSPCQMMIGVYNHLLSKVFSFHYHSQKVIGSLGLDKISVNGERWDVFRRVMTFSVDDWTWITMEYRKEDFKMIFEQSNSAACFVNKWRCPQNSIDGWFVRNPTYKKCGFS